MKKLYKFSALIISVLLFSVFVLGCNGDPDVSKHIEVTHIINPNTGLPYTLRYNESSGRYENTESHIISATILSDSSLEGDSYATAVCVMGLDDGIAFMESRGLSGLLFTKDKRIAVVGDVYSASFLEKGYSVTYGQSKVIPDIGNTEVEQDSILSFEEFVFSDGILFSGNLYGGDKAAARDEMLAEIRKMDAEISLSKEGSEIVELNKSNKNIKVEIGFHSYKLISEAKRIYTETGGAFNIAAARLSSLWNVDIAGINKYKPFYDVDPSEWEQPESLPSPAEVEAVKAYTDLDLLHVEYNEAEQKYYAYKDIDELEVDLGGIAKGYAVDVCKRICDKYSVTGGYVNISGNLYLLDALKMENGKYSKIPWSVSVNSPTDKLAIFREKVCKFESLGDGSVVTSGDYERFYYYLYK